LRCPHIHRPFAAACAVEEQAAARSAQWHGDNLPDGRHGADLNRQVWDSTPCPTPCRARMPGQYSTRCGQRPSTGAARAEDTPGRLFLCGRCRVQVLICSCCDRGQIYCAGGCAREARQQAQRDAGRRYQASFRGRVNHAARSSRWRAQQKNVTHQSSPPRADDDLVVVDAAIAASSRPVTATSDGVGRSPGLGAESWRCHWCGRRCPPLVRIGFLRRCRSGARRRPDIGGRR